MNSINKKIIQEYWTKNAPGLDMVSKKYSSEQKEFYIYTDEYRYRYDSYIVPLIDSFVEKGKVILEIGCGMGTDSRYISRKGAHIVSLDLSYDNISFTLKGMYLLNLNGEGVCADAENLPFKDNLFDVVYSFGVLHHTPNTRRAIDEIYRVLKPSGKCIIMLYHKGYAYYLLLLRYIHLFVKSKLRNTSDILTSKYDHTPLSRMYSKKQIRELFRKFNNLELEMTTYGGIQNHRLLRYMYQLLHKSRFLMNRFGSYLLIKGRK